MFKSANKPMGITVALDPNDKAIAQGKKKYFGERLVGKFLSTETVKTDMGMMTCYMLHLYADPTNEAMFGKQPDGEVVSLRSTKIIGEAFEHGTDGSGIQPGDIVEIVNHGHKFGKTGFAKEKGYWDVSIGSFRPGATFAPAAPVNTVAPEQPAVTQAPSPASAGVAAAKRIGY